MTPDSSRSSAVSGTGPIVMTDRVLGVSDCNFSSETDACVMAKVKCIYAQVVTGANNHFAELPNTCQPSGSKLLPNRACRRRWSAAPIDME